MGRAAATATALRRASVLAMPAAAAAARTHIGHDGQAVVRKHEARRQLLDDLVRRLAELLQVLHELEQARGHALEPRIVRAVLAHRKRGPERVVLRTHAEREARAAELAAAVKPIYKGVAGRGGDKARQHSDGRRLAAPVLAEKPEARPGQHGEREVRHGNLGALRGACARRRERELLRFAVGQCRVHVSGAAEAQAAAAGASGSVAETRTAAAATATASAAAASAAAAATAGQSDNASAAAAETAASGRGHVRASRRSASHHAAGCSACGAPCRELLAQVVQQHGDAPRQLAARKLGLGRAVGRARVDARH